MPTLTVIHVNSRLSDPQPLTNDPRMKYVLKEGRSVWDAP
jgi:hypothetical protein